MSKSSTYIHLFVETMYNKEQPYNNLPVLPPTVDIESKTILKQAIAANKVLAELKVNDRLGTEFTEGDKLFFDQIGFDLAKNETIIKQAKNNSFENFVQGSLRDLSIQQFIDRMDANSDTTEKMLTNEKLADAVIFKYLAKVIYDRINSF